MNKKILIIGSTSFIGCNVAFSLNKAGYSVDCVTTRRKKESIKNKRLNFLKKNKIKILKKNLLKEEEFFELKKYQVIINAIGWTENYSNDKFDVIEVRKKYQKFYKNLENFFKINSPKIFIEIGSSAEYGKNYSKFSEKSKCNPDTKYGILKLNNTKKLEKISKNFNISIIILRVFSIFGYLDRGDKLIEHIKNNKRVFINKPKIKQDFISINFLNKIIFKIIKKKNLKKFNIYNCSSGIGVTPLEIINFNKSKKFKKKKIELNIDNNQNLTSPKKISIGKNEKIIKELKITKPDILKEIKKYLLNN